jgi:hypothetical protein
MRSAAATAMSQPPWAVLEAASEPASPASAPALHTHMFGAESRSGSPFAAGSRTASPAPALAPRSVSRLSPPPRTPTAPVPVTPRPDLLFAIAADDPGAVRRVLASGAADPNDAAGPGPQSALEFAVANGALARRVEIVRTLLAYGADPAVLAPSPEQAEEAPGSVGLEELDPATK